MPPRVPMRWMLLCLACTGCHGERHDLTEAQMAPVIAAGRRDLQRCYQEALDRKPHADEVHIDAELHIGMGGRVYELTLGPGALPGMEPCLREAIEQWRFPRAEDATHAALPLVFRPEAPAAGAVPKPQ